MRCHGSEASRIRAGVLADQEALVRSATAACGSLNVSLPQCVFSGQHGEDAAVFALLFANQSRGVYVELGAYSQKYTLRDLLKSIP